MIKKTILSGILTGVCFLIPELSYGIFVSIIPFLMVIFKENLTLKQGFKIGLFFGLCLYFIVSSFIIALYPMEFLNISKPLSIVFIIFAYLFIAFYEGLFIGLITMVFIKFKKGNGWDILLFAFLYTVMEIVLSFGMFGFTFGHLYATQYKNLPVIQSSAFLSCYFITFIILVIGGMLAYSFKSKLKYAVVAIAIFSSNYIFGIIKIETFKPTGEEIKVSLIQGNISSNSKWEETGSTKIFETYKNLTLEAIKNDNPKIIVWPETTIPISITANSVIYSQLQDIAASNNVMLITGAFLYDEELKGDYNSILVFDNNGNFISPPYHKRHLVPMGEFMPFEKFFGKIFPSLNLKESPVLKGDDTNIIPTQYGDIAGLICFDSIFSHLAKKSVKDGGDLLTIVTNDSWFKDSHGVYAHNAQAVFRAVENNIYVVRCANTGVSTFINPTGKILKSLPPLAQGYITENIFIKTY